MEGLDRAVTFSDFFRDVSEATKTSLGRILCDLKQAAVVGRQSAQTVGAMSVAVGLACPEMLLQ